ncbi:MAG: hypothetical protein K2Y37_19080 [Pirellulales bacterium]|nr:hypothetical protein [Pirellulales bacterium]
MAAYRNYMWAICNGDLKGGDDASDAFQDASLRIFRGFQRGCRFDCDQKLKAYIRATTKGAVLDLLRSKHGRRKKDGQKKNTRPQQIELKEAAFEKLLDQAALDGQDPNLLLHDWADVIRHEAGDEVAVIFELKAKFLTNSDIAALQGMTLADVTRRLNQAWEVWARHFRRG